MLGRGAWGVQTCWAGGWSLGAGGGSPAGFYLDDFSEAPSQGHPEMQDGEPDAGNSFLSWVPGLPCFLPTGVSTCPPQPEGPGGLLGVQTGLVPRPTFLRLSRIVTNMGPRHLGHDANNSRILKLEDESRGPASHRDHPAAGTLTR